MQYCIFCLLFAYLLMSIYLFGIQVALLYNKQACNVKIKENRILNKSILLKETVIAMLQFSIFNKKYV